MSILEQTEGPDSADVANVLNDWVALYLAQGDIVAAEPLADRPRTIIEQLFRHEGIDPDSGPLPQKLPSGDDIPVEIHLIYQTALGNLGELYRQQGNYTAAEPLVTRALHLAEQVLPPDHASIATCLNNRGVLCKYLGQYEQAEPFARQALQIREQCLGHDHPEVVITLSTLAAILEGQDKLDEAEQLYLRSLRILEAKFGPAHRDVAMNLNNLAARAMSRSAYICVTSAREWPRMVCAASSP